MTQEHFFVTGALGCIGAWVVRELVRQGIPVTVFDLAGNPQRLQLIMDDGEISRVQFITGDIADFKSVKNALQAAGASHIIHLAAMQVPFCKADPVLGAQVNVVGTVNVFEAAKQLGLPRVVYASSIAVYGLSEEYPEGQLGHEAQLKPRTHYGVYKQANEGTARVYWLDDGLSSIGLRPYIVYGPGRDQGLTAGPTKAMLAAAAGLPYHIPFGGQGIYQYTQDVARTFIQAARVPFEGAQVFNIRGTVVHMGEMVAVIEAAEPGMRGRLTFDDKPLPFPTDVEDSALRAALGEVPHTPLAEAVASTIAIFRSAIATGRIQPEKML